METHEQAAANIRAANKMVAETKLARAGIELEHRQKEFHDACEASRNALVRLSNAMELPADNDAAIQHAKDLAASCVTADMLMAEAGTALHDALKAQHRAKQNLDWIGKPWGAANPPPVKERKGHWFKRGMRWLHSTLSETFTGYQLIAYSMIVSIVWIFILRFMG